MSVHDISTVCVSSVVHGEPPILTASHAALCDDGVALMFAQGMPGFSLGQKIEGKCGMRASMTAELVFDGVEASASGVLVLPKTPCLLSVYSFRRVGYRASQSQR